MIINEEIRFIFYNIFPIEVMDHIINIKNKVEEKETLDYHIERWEKISSLYFRSFESYNDIDKTKIFLSYTIDSKIFVAKPDKNLDFYYETGTSYQVRNMLLDILNTKEWEEHHWHDIREHDDNLYGVLSKKIMKEIKDKIEDSGKIKYNPKKFFQPLLSLMER